MGSAWDNLINSKTITQLPHYAISKSLPADSYFTSRKTAEKCFAFVKDTINVNDYTFIEPSAGEGSFYDLLPEDRRIGIELHSRRPEFIQQDYLTWYPPSNSDKKYNAGGGEKNF